MADRRRLVRIAWDGTVTTVRDLEDSATFYAVRDTFTITPGQRKPVSANSNRRYAGSRPVAESHENGRVSWKMLVAGATADAVLASVEAALGDLESATDRLFLAWRPDGATNSTYYELRGNPEWTPTYSWAQFAGAKSMYVDVAIPVAPLAWGAKQTIDLISSVDASTTFDLPATVALDAPIPGDAPALVDLSLTSPGSLASAPIWALIGWTRAVSAPLSGSIPPFGLIEAETGGSLSGWSVISGGTAHGGDSLAITASGAGSASALYGIDPSVLAPDDFTPDEVDVEVWARIAISDTLVAPRMTLSLLPLAGATFGGEQFSAEYGSAGKLLVSPASTQVFRFVRLGTLNLPIDTARPLKWNMKVAASWAAGSSGQLALDYLALVPAKQRAVSVSGKANDSGYSKFLGTTAAATKTIRSDLSGLTASGAGNPGVSPGLGGCLLEMPPGDVDLLIKLSDLVADDPTIDDSSEALSFAGFSGQLLVTPRYWLARGS